MQKLAGPSSEWVLDAAGAMTPGDAATIAVALEASHPIWFDEPTAVTSPDSLAKIVDESVMPIGLGRDITDLSAFQTLLVSGSVNIVRPDLALDSLTKIKRVAALAETHYVGIAPFHNGGPIGSMAGIHLNASLLYAYAQQIPVPASDRDTKPGLGVDISEAALKRYPFQGTRPFVMAFHEDGAVGSI